MNDRPTDEMLAEDAALMLTEQLDKAPSPNDAEAISRRLHALSQEVESIGSIVDSHSSVLYWFLIFWLASTTIIFWLLLKR